MGNAVAAYFDLDGTLLNASSEKTLAGHLARRRPWRIPWGTVAWTAGFLSNLLRGRAVYDAARNRGHFSLASWQVLEHHSSHLAEERLKPCIPPEAWEKLAWHREQGHRLVLVTATVAPMAEAMGRVLGMDAVYGCGPPER
ncbi:MAG: HAD family hydrolase, partial [Candidatus Thermoplasmatota archaeon]|nr:HAD family hydrolase [Candidatus Thermoplasmatota archaeon]